MNSLKAQRVEWNNKNNDKKVEFKHKIESLKKIQGETELEIENVGSQTIALEISLTKRVPDMEVRIIEEKIEEMDTWI